MATLSDLRLRVYQQLDDDGTGTANGTRWLLTEVDAALAAAVDIIAATYASLGGTKLDEYATVTLTAGSGDLSSLRPLSIRSVAINYGNSYYPVSQLSENEAYTLTGAYGTIRVRLVKSATFPTASGDTVGYGSTSSIPLFDKLIVDSATRMLLNKDREQIAGLEKQHQELLQALVQTETVLAAMDAPGPCMKYPVFYTLVGNTIQTVYRPGALGPDSQAYYYGF
jgi:hypothetical protein